MPHLRQTFDYKNDIFFYTRSDFSSMYLKRHFRISLILLMHADIAEIFSIASRFTSLYYTRAYTVRTDVLTPLDSSHSHDMPREILQKYFLSRSHICCTLEMLSRGRLFEVERHTQRWAWDMPRGHFSLSSALSRPLNTYGERFLIFEREKRTKFTLASLIERVYLLLSHRHDSI